MRFYKPDSIHKLFGKQVMYRHIAGGPIFGPYTVLSYHANSHTVCVSVEGRPGGFFLDTALFEEVA